VLSVLLVASAANAQGFNRGAPPAAPTEIPGEGTEFFRALLHLRNVKPVKEQELRNLSRYDDVIVIVLGGQNKFGWPDGLQYANNAILGGGAILIASHDNVSLNFGLGNDQISGVRVECQELTSTLRNHLRDCPYVVPIADQGDGQGDPQAEVRKLFIGQDLKLLTRVAAGTPSYILLDRTTPHDQSLVPLAKFPNRSSWNDASGDHAALPQGALFAAGGEWTNFRTRQPYRFLAVASSRAFNNGMLYDNDTQNLEWSDRVIGYLKGPDQRRTRCVFFENGRIVDHFDDLSRLVSKQSQPMPSMNLGAIQDKLVDKGNGFLDQLQTNNAFNNALNRVVALPVIMWLFLLLASIAACWFLLRRAIGSRKPTNIPPAPTLARASSEPPGVFDRRQKELLRRNNVYEPVRDLIREFFATVGIRGEQGPKPPKLSISDVVRKPDSLRLAIKDLWRLAYGPPKATSVNRWQELEPYFERVKQAHADGKWAFAFEAWADTKFDD
jgi:hypothetical protein